MIDDVLFRTSSDHARRVVEQLFPTPGPRDSIIRVLAEAVLHAHEHGPGSWGITLRKDGLRFNTGSVESISLAVGCPPLFVVDRAMLALAFPEGIHPSITAHEPAHYKSAPDTIGIDVEPNSLENIYPLVRAAHRCAIERCVKRGYSWKEAHSPGVVAYLAAETGMTIPSPNYRQPRTFLLTWNPDKWEWSDRLAATRLAAAEHTIGWSTGIRRDLKRGERVFLMALGAAERPGIIAAGWATSEPAESAHWDAVQAAAGAKMLRGEFAFETILALEDVLELNTLRAAQPNVNWTPQGSGIEISTEVAAVLERLWAAHVGAKAPSDTADSELNAMEGALRLYVVRHRRRERGLREAKIAAVAGSKGGKLLCEIEGCGFDFEATYGEIGRGFAHVHHLNPLSDTSDPSVTRMEDLIVIWPQLPRNDPRRRREPLARRAGRQDFEAVGHAPLTPVGPRLRAHKCEYH